MKAKLWTFSGWIASLTPLLIVVSKNWDYYVATETKAWGLTIGGIMLATIIILSAMGQAKAIFGRGLVTVGVIYIMVHFLSPIFLELEKLLWWLFVGLCMKNIIFDKIAKASAKKQGLKEQSNVMKDAVETILNGGNKV